MHKQRHLISVFFFFLLISGVFSAVSLTPAGMRTRGLLEVMSSFVRTGMLAVVAAPMGKISALQQLRDENVALRSKIASYQEQEREIRALRDQFAVTMIDPQALLPVKIIGRRTILPGVSLPDQLILNKGTSDGVRKGSTIVYKNIFLGQIRTVTDHLSIVDLSYRKDFSITASVADSGALGVITGGGMGELLLDKVILSDKLNVGSNVITKGNIDEEGRGVPPGLLIGKIVSIDKKPSALFQTAKVALDFDIAKLDSVFILMQSR